MDTSRVLRYRRLDRLETVELAKGPNVVAAGDNARFLEHRGHATDLEIAGLDLGPHVVPLLAPSADSVLVPRLQRLSLIHDSRDWTVERIAALRDVLLKRYERLGLMPELVFGYYNDINDPIPLAALGELDKITTTRVVERKYWYRNLPVPVQ